jgi:hypothetical protein
MKAPTCIKDVQKLNRVHGVLEQIHLEAWRMGTTLLQTTQASREVHVDRVG